MDNLKQMSPAEFVKHAAENHIKFILPEDNRKYPMQQCQDDLLNQKFRVLHKQIVNAIIQFCKENDIVIDKFQLNADCPLSNCFSVFQVTLLSFSSQCFQLLTVHFQGLGF